VSDTPTLTEVPPTQFDWIVGFERMDPKLLAANPLNFRVHPEEQRAAWRSAKQHIGWLQAVL